jgi:hypothetical protein
MPPSVGGQRSSGAVLLGKADEKLNLTAIAC